METIKAEVRCYISNAMGGSSEEQLSSGVGNVAGDGSEGKIREE